MRNSFLLIGLMATAVSAAAQSTPVKSLSKPKVSSEERALRKSAGTWNGRAMTEGFSKKAPRLSETETVSTFVTMSTGTRSGWMTTFPKREPLPVRVISAGGDSVVTEVGPYPSITRAGQTATTGMTMHFTGRLMRGTFTATFNDGRILTGKVRGKRVK